MSFAQVKQMLWLRLISTLFVVLAVGGIMVRLAPLSNGAIRPEAHSDLNNDLNNDLRREEADQQLIDELGLGKNWHDYNSSKAGLIATWAPMAVKIVFEVPESSSASLHYLVDIKRAGGRKDQHLEFPGGRVNTGEDAVAALLRELQEEDPSGILKASLRASLTASSLAVSFKNLSLEDGERHTLFKTKLSREDWLHLQNHGAGSRNKEIYAYKLVTLRELDTRSRFERKLWTPKSRKILKALRRNS